MGKAMACRDLRELLVAYLDGEATPEQRALVQQHLSSCPDCRQELESLSSTQQHLRQVLKVKADDMVPSPRVWTKIQKRTYTTPLPSVLEKVTGWLREPWWQTAMAITLVSAWMVMALWGIGVVPGLPNLTTTHSTVAETTVSVPAKNSSGISTRVPFTLTQTIVPAPVTTVTPISAPVGTSTPTVAGTTILAPTTTLVTTSAPIIITQTALVLTTVPTISTTAVGGPVFESLPTDTLTQVSPTVVLTQTPVVTTPPVISIQNSVAFIFAGVTLVTGFAAVMLIWLTRTHRPRN